MSDSDNEGKITDNATDFDIENYNIQELISIIGLANEVPLTNEKIVSRITTLKERFNEKPDGDVKDNFLDFFDQIQEKLLNNKKEETVEDLFEKQEANLDDFGRITRPPIEYNSRAPRQLKLHDNDGYKNNY